MRYYLIFLFFIAGFNISSQASWDSFVNALENRKTGSYYFGNSKNPGINSGKITYDYSGWDPAWNRDDAIGGNCLNQYSLNDYGMFSDHTCVQEKSNNSYHSPRVIVKNFTCWFGGCWNTSFSLNGIEGECNVVPTQDVVIAKRMCARIASPAGDGNPADPGYTSALYAKDGVPIDNIVDSNGKPVTLGQHLDTYGVTYWDDLVSDDAGNKFPILAPKICVYEDPWTMDLWVAAKGYIPDLFDIDPTHQPFHQSLGDLSPIAKIIIFVLQTVTNIASSSVDIVGMIMAGITAMDSGVSSSISNVFNIISNVIQQFASVIVDLLQDIGQINRVVIQSNNDNNGNYGCINIPLGPYPPPYCYNKNSGSSFLTKAIANAFPICLTDEQGELILNTNKPANTYANQSTKCVLSDVDNNFIHNSLRVAYTNPLPLCSSATETNCFLFNKSTSLPINDSKLLRNTLVKSNNFISSSDVTLLSPSTPAITTSGKYRVLYSTYSTTATTSGSKSLISTDQYYYQDLLDCDDLKQNGAQPGFALNACQSFYGIDVGDFSDEFILDYSAGLDQQNANNTQSVTLKYAQPSLATAVFTSNNFYARIDPANALGEISVYQQVGMGQDPENDTSVSPSSIPRAPLPDYANYCDSSGNCNLTDLSQYISGLNVWPCASSYPAQPNVAPCMNVGLKAIGATGNTYFISNKLSLNKFIKSAGNTNPQIYLAGMNFGAYVTDNFNQLKPYVPSAPSSNAFNLNGQVYSNSILGSYINNNILDTTNCDWDSCAKYLNGLEVIQDYYVRGGSWFCLNNSSSYDKSYKDDQYQAVLANTANGSSAASNLLKDRITPATKIGDPTLQYDEYYNNDPMQCLKNKQANGQYTNISMCMPDCATSPAPCYNLTLQDNSCSSTPIYSYNQGNTNSSETLQNSSSAVVTNSSGQRFNNSVQVDNKNGYLIFNQQDSAGNLLTSITVMIDIKASKINIYNQTTSANTNVFSYTNSVISPNVALSLTTSPVATGQTTKTQVIIPQAQTSYGSKSIAIDANKLTLTLNDSANSQSSIVVFVDVVNGFVHTQNISSNSTNDIIFNPVNNQTTSINTVTSGSTTTTTEINPSANTRTITSTINNSALNSTNTNISVSNFATNITQSSTTIAQVSSGSTLTTTTSSYDQTGALHSKNIAVTTTANGLDTMVTTYYDSNGNVIGTPITSTKASSDNSYYCYVQSTNNQNSSQAVRSKIGAERINRCIPVSQPVACSAFTDTSKNVTWNQAGVGSLTTGSCTSGYIPVDSTKMQAYCLMQYANATYPSVIDSSDTNLFAGCKVRPNILSNLAFSHNSSNSWCSQNIQGSPKWQTSDNTFGFSAQFKNMNWYTCNEKFNISFDLLDPKSIAIQFTSISYAGFLQIIVNGNAIYNNSFYNNSFNVNGNAIYNNSFYAYNNSLSDLTLLNASLASYLKSGSNTIEFIYNYSSGINVEFQYNQL